MQMASSKCSPEAISLSDRASSVSSVVAALGDLFVDCVRDKWTPLGPEQRDRLAQQFEETLARVTDKLDSTFFGSFHISYFMHATNFLEACISVS